jgi:MFS family permease
MFSLLWAGLFLSLICVHLDLDNFSIGLVNAVPNLVLPTQIISALLLMRYGKRRQRWLLVGSLSRALLLLLGPLIYLYSDERSFWVIPSFLVLYFLIHLGQALNTPLWFSWLGDLIPEHESARFWGKRNMIVFIGGLIISVALGFVLDLEVPRGALLSVIIGIAGLLALLEIYTYRGVPSSECSLDTETKPFELFKDIFSNKDFCAFAGYNTLFSFATFLFLPFLFIHLGDLGLSSFWIQLLLAIGSVGAMIGSLFWSNLAPTSGYKQILLICTVLKGFVFCLYFVVGKETSIPFFCLFYLGDGFLNGGLFTSNLALLTAETPQKTRGLITALFFSLTGVAGLFGSLSSGVLMNFFTTYNPLVDYHVVPFHYLMLIAVVIVFLSSISMAYYRGRVEGTTWNTISMFFEGNPFLSFFRLTSLSGRGTLKDRIAFISRNRSPLFTQELIDATKDASATVRWAAVSSLGEIKDKRATHTLLSLLENRDSGVSVQAAYSLGALESIEAVHSLHSALKSENPDLRAAAASSLARIGDRTSLKPLKEHLLLEESPFVAAALSDSISHFRDLSVVPAIIPRFRKTLAPGIRVQYAVAVANMLGKFGEFYRLITSENRQPGSGIVKMYKDIHKAIKKRQLNLPSINNLADFFDEERYGEVIRILFRTSYHIHYPNLDLEDLNSKEVWDWSNDDFENALGNNNTMINHSSALEYSLWLLTALNIRGNDEEICTKEEALLALYVFREIC